MSRVEINVRKQRDRVGNEVGSIFDFNFNSGNCSAIPQDLRPEAY